MSLMRRHIMPCHTFGVKLFARDIISNCCKTASFVNLRSSLICTMHYDD